MAGTTNGDTSAGGRKFPEIFLDTTLAELLAEDNKGQVAEALCTFKPCANPRHKTVPLNKKYLITSTKATDSNDLAHLQLESVSYLLSFWAGSMDVLMVACEGTTDDMSLTKDAIQQNAQVCFSVLNEKQRPRPRVFANSHDFVQNCKTSTNPTRWGFAVDFAEQVRCVFDPEIQFLMNSKRWLADCPLKSANDEIIDSNCSCETHTSKHGLWYYVGDNCTICKDEVTKELSRLENKLNTREPPFVLKLTQSLGSVGTMLVKNEEDRLQTIKDIVEIQRECLPYITAENGHIYPASLVLSDFLPGDTHALNFFIRRDGSVKFLGSCAQLGTRISGGGRQHTAITFSHQEELQKKFQGTLDRIGKVLYDTHGYFGPCGADIMIDPDENDRQYVIDLNVRTPTSLVLYLLKSHCQARSFDVCGIYECLLLTVSRDDLAEKFHKEFNEGRLIVLGTTKLSSKDVWAFPIVLCGEDADAVEKLSKRLTDLEVGTIGGGGADGDGEEAADAGGA